MKVEYEHAVEIGAPAHAVWPVMSDVERWPEWTASVSQAHLLDDGGLRPGQRARLRQPRLPVAVWTVDEVVPGRNFAWHSRAVGLRSRGEHTVEPTGGQTCRAVLRLTHEGVLAGLVRIVYGRLIRQYVGFEADGLKRQAERQIT
jgi:uncharacterized membrane protein